MIYTLTLNPALDYQVRLGQLRTGGLNRAQAEAVFAGGKGINVSRMLHAFGMPSTALGFIAGETGELIRAMAERAGVHTDFVQAEGQSRINVKILAGEETQINGAGPALGEDAVLRLGQKISALPQGSILVLAGNAPLGAPDGLCARLLGCAGAGIRVAADVSGAQLRELLPLRPWLVKPNREELCEALGLHSLSARDALPCAHKLREMGAANAIVSLGEEGAAAVFEDGEEAFVPAFRGRAADTVGAGDSLLAGFLCAKERGESSARALRFGVAAGCATSFRFGLASAEEVYALLRE